MIRYPRSALISISILTACRSASTPPPEPGPPSVIPVTSAPTNTAVSRWSIPLTTGTHKYASTSRTIIQRILDQTGRRDTIDISIWFTLSDSEHTDSILIRGSIDSIRSKTSLPITRQAAPFTISIKSGQIKLQPPGAATPDYPCSNSAIEPVGEILASLVTRPIDLSTSSIWTDTSTTATCSGKLPVMGQRIRSYQVIGQEIKNGTPTLELHRFETSTFSGSGTQNQHQVTIMGKGQTTSQILIDITSGIFINSTTQETASFSITTSGQANQFIQQIDQSVTLIR